MDAADRIAQSEQVFRQLNERIEAGLMVEKVGVTGQIAEDTDPRET